LPLFTHPLPPFLLAVRMTDLPHDADNFTS
jgi:hypothetical protein